MARDSLALVDVSWPITNRIASYPGNPPVRLTDFLTVKKDGTRVSLLSLGSHTGTHYDAPNHFFEGEPGVDAIPLDAGVGPCRVVELTRVRGQIGRADLEPHRPRAGERLLLKTRNSDFPTEGFREGFAGVEPEAAEYLASHKVRLVGIDYLSIEPFGRPEPTTHRTLIRAGVTILEGLRLKHAAPGDYRLHAPPLLYVGGDGAPARAVLEPEGTK